MDPVLEVSLLGILNLCCCVLHVEGPLWYRLQPSQNSAQTVKNPLEEHSACGCKLLFCLLCTQAQRIQQYMAINGRDVYILVILSSMLALSYNIVHSLMILHTSAVATTVIGEAKIIGLLILSYFLLGE